MIIKTKCLPIEPKWRENDICTNSMPLRLLKFKLDILEVNKTSAVDVHIKKVVIYTPSIWLYPWESFSSLVLVSDVEDAIAPVPMPASLENIPLCIPVIADNKNPVEKDLTLNADDNIFEKIYGILFIFLKIIKNANEK